MDNYQDYIEVNPEIMMGKPVIKGTRITVELILEKLSAGETIEEILDAHHRLSREAVLAALGFLGIILIRLMGLKASIKTEILKKVILNHEDNLLGSLVVVQPGAIRIRKFQR